MGKTLGRLSSSNFGWLVRGSGAVLAGTVLVALSSSAWADTGSDNTRASFAHNNVTTCSAVGLASDTQVGSATDGNANDANAFGTVKTNAGTVHTGQGEELDVAITASNSANIVVDAIVVKGGNGYNLYSNATYLPPTLRPDQHYISPFNNGGNIPTISHWFVCYHIAPGATTPEIPVAIALPIAGAAIFGTFWFVRRRRSGSLAS